MKKLLRLISVATMLLAATTFMACSSDDDDGPSESSSATRVGSGAFVGVVLDNTGKPVEGATVTLGNKTASTNKGGEFKLEGVAVNDPVVRSIQTTVGSGTVTNGDEKLEPKDSTSTSTERKYAYTLTVTKDGYIPGTVDSMYVSEAEDIGGIEDARLSALKNQYAKILDSYAGAVGTGSITGSSSGDGYFLTGNAPEDKSATMTSVAAALKEIQNLYAHLGKTYSSTFVECKSLVPLNASLSGKLKLNPSPATAEVYNETTYPAPKDTVVTVTYTHDKNSAPYTFKTKTDAEGNFKFEKLPSGVALSIEVEGFTAKAGEVEAYFSTDVGAYRSNAAEILNNGTYDDSTSKTKGTVTIYGNSLNVAGVDIMLFAQLEKIWVKETNLIKNNSAALISVKTPLEFTFNKAIQRVDIAGSGFQDVKDDNYVVTIDSTDAKKVTITPKDGIWTPKAAGTEATDAKAGEVRLSVLAADGTKELLNDKFTAYFDTTIYVEISDSSKNDVELGLTQPVKLTFSKPMTTASVVAYKVFDTSTKTALANAFSKTWNEGKTELTLTPTTFWDEVSDDNGKVVFTVEGLAQDLTDDVRYWKNNVQTLTTGTGASAVTKNAGLIAYFDNKIDVTVAKVDDKSFTLTFSKAIKALTKDDIATAVTVTHATTKAGLATSTAAVTDFEAKFNDTNTVLTISAKNNDFANTGYYRVTLGAAVVGKTGETKFRAAGTTTLQTTTKNFDTDFTVGPEKFAETAVEIVTELPAGAEQSRAAFVTAEKYLKLTFNKAVRSSKLLVYDKSSTSYKDVNNYVADKSVYLALNKLSDESELKVQGTVTAVDGATKTWATGKELETGYALSKLTYKMVSTSLYKETVSIAAGQNDAKVEKIQPTDSITFTFDQDVSTAKWTAELYDSDKVGSNDLTQTSYAVTATAAGKVVTVALTEASKKLDFGKTYYLSLKATKGNDVDTVVLFNTDKATTADFANLVSDPTASLSTKILKKAVGEHNYIKIETVGYYVVPAGDKSATTKFDEFKKSISSPIVIEFTQDITGFTAVLAKAKETDYFYEWKKATDVKAADTYASKAEVEGKKLTITPKFAFASKSAVVPYVFNAKGEIVELKDAAGNALISKDNAAKQFVAKDLTDEKDLSAALDSTPASTEKALALTQFNVNETGNGTQIWFQFDPILSTTDSNANYGKYTLYRKATAATTAATKWEKVGKTYTISPATGEADLQYIDVVADAASDTDKKNNVKTAVINDFRLRGRKAAIVADTGAKEFDYSRTDPTSTDPATSVYRLVCSIDNVEIYSAPVTVADKFLDLKVTDGADAMTPTGYTTETTVTTKIYKFTAPCYIVNVATNVTRGTAAAVVTESTRLGPKNASRVKVDLNAARTEITLTIDNDTTAGTGDKIILTATDAGGVSKQYTIEYKN